ncbi:lipid A deacylase LpxR family protein [Herminiimonas sp. CN]|uniref:lipid A deacylase LpxR family protein n=1 Tax=Herminiimonas sp. CN TaxID=1349818 RepID=UPI000473B849|nr:lipid A deacylase LpxR family protein [Herminiimonas sp. CN]
MARSFLQLLAAGLLLLHAILVRADAVSAVPPDFRTVMAHGRSSIALDIDNDSLLMNRDDGFYTSGLRLTQQYALRDAAQLTAYGWRIGHDMYTPSDIKLPPAQVRAPDHPYAAWLYGGLFREVRQVDGAYARLGFDLGCLGPCAAGEWVQTNLHRLINQPLPQGWSRQVKNEFGAVLYADIAPARWPLQRWLDLQPSLQGRVGNIFTDLTAAVTLRAGVLGDLPAAPTQHLYLKFSARAVGHDASLQGGYFSRDNPHTVRPQRLAEEAEAGLQWVRPPFALRAAIVRRSNEIRDLPDSVGAQNFARLQLVYSP